MASRKRAGRRKKRVGNGSLRDAEMAGMASSDDADVSGAPLFAEAASETEKKAPALTLAQARVLIDHGVSRDRLTDKEAIEIVRYRQERNYAAYCSHRKRTLKKNKARRRKPK